MSEEHPGLISSGYSWHSGADTQPRLVPRTPLRAAGRSVASATPPAATSGRVGSLVPVGLPGVDQILGGGIRTGELLLLAGDAGSGTTSLAAGIALRSSLLSAPDTEPDPAVTAGFRRYYGTRRGGSRALFMTTEQSREAFATRLLAMVARTPVSLIRSSALDDISSARMTAAAARLSWYGPLIASAYHGLDPIDELTAQFPDTRLVIIDSVDLMRLNAGDDIAGTLRRLKEIAVTRDLAIIAVVHTASVALGRRPRLDDLPQAADSSAAADIVLALFREEVYEQLTEIDGAAELLVLKHREMAGAYADLYFDAAKLTFEDLLESE